MRRLGVAAAAAAALAGCGEDRIDTERLERELERQIEAQTRVPLAAVECPDDVAVSDEGFQCTVRGEGGREVEVPISQDGEGNVRFQTPDLSALRPGGRPPEGGGAGSAGGE